MSARRIKPTFVPRIWGSTQLAPWFPNQTEKIGEVWFPAGALLIKFLFTSENLSVQVHPDDAYARENENSLGKTEMWHVLRAEPDARVALGFEATVECEALRDLCRSGKVLDRLGWRPAHPGDTFLVPAGTVHAIGAGLALCEIQENSDITYRLFDYGRPRELHLERALAVMRCERHAGATVTRTLGEGHDELCSCEHFVTERLSVNHPAKLRGEGYAVVLEGHGTLDGQPFAPGTVWRLSEDLVAIEPAIPTSLLLTRVP